MSAQRIGFVARLARRRETRGILFLALLSVAFLSLALAANSPDLLALDRDVTLGIQRLRCLPLDLLARAFTFMGNSGVLMMVAVAAAVVLRRESRPRAAALAAASIVGLPLNMLVKNIVERPRPTSELVEVITPALGLSFPSGHAMASLLVYGFIAFMIWVHVPDRKHRLVGTILLGTLGFGIGLSRIYLGVHWLSDVAGGWTAGFFLLLLFAEIYNVIGTPELAPRT